MQIINIFLKSYLNAIFKWTKPIEYARSFHIKLTQYMYVIYIWKLNICMKANITVCVVVALPLQEKDP